MAKYADTECYEEHATIQESVTRDQAMTATVVLRTPWSKRYDLVNELLSDNAYPFPHTPVGWTLIWPTGIQMRPERTKYTTDSDGQVIDYTYDALVTVRYGVIQVQTDPASGKKTMLNETLEPDVEYLTQDHKSFAWRTGDPDALGDLAYALLKEEEAPGKLQRSLTLVRQLYYQPFVHGSALTLPGHVNNRPYFSNILGLTFGTETLLFSPPNLQRTFTNATPPTKGWTITARFHFKPQGWNRFWRADSQQWVEMYRLNKETKSYILYKPNPLGDFSPWLF